MNVSTQPMIAFDEFGRPFVILRDQSIKKRLAGLEAQKVASFFMLKNREGELTMLCCVVLCCAMCCEAPSSHCMILTLSEFRQRRYNLLLYASHCVASLTASCVNHSVCCSWYQ